MLLARKKLVIYAESYMKKFKIKYPIGSLIKISEFKSYASKPIVSIGLILDIDYLREEVTVLSNNKAYRKNIQQFKNGAKTLQRPYKK